MTIAEFIKQSVSLLQVDTERARIDIEYLLCYILNQNRAYLFSHQSDVLPAEILQKLIFLRSRRQQGEPIAYITETKGFWKHDFYVSPATLIPRPETELLIETALALLEPTRTAHILELGTGSGAIAISLALESSNWQIMAVDNSQAALKVAGENASRLHAKNVYFKESHWFDAVDGLFDLIVANPPYLATDDPHLQQGDVAFEPVTALVAGQAGLDDLAEIIQTAPQFLKKNGLVILEHGYNQSTPVQQLFQARGFVEIHSIKDLQNWPRVTRGIFV